MPGAQKQLDLDSKRAVGGNSAIDKVAELYFLENECLRVSTLPYDTRYDILERQSVICCPVRVLHGSEREKALRLMKKYG